MKIFCNQCTILAVMGGLLSAFLLGGCGGNNDADLGANTAPGGSGQAVVPLPGMPGSVQPQPVAGAPATTRPGMPPLGQLPSLPAFNPNAPVGGAPVGGAPVGGAPTAQ